MTINFCGILLNEAELLSLEGAVFKLIHFRHSGYQVKRKLRFHLLGMDGRMFVASAIASAEHSN